MDRRAISISGELYAVLRHAADVENVTLSHLVEREMRAFAAMPPRPPAAPAVTGPGAKTRLIGTTAMVEAVFAAPAHDFTVAELWQLRGGSILALRVELSRLRADGVLRRGKGRGFYRAGRDPDVAATARGTAYTCARCRHAWHGRGTVPPQRCPQCKSYLWQHDRAAPSPSAPLPAESSIKVGPPPEQTAMLGRTETPAPPRITTAAPPRNLFPAEQQRPRTKAAPPTCPCCGRPSMRAGARCGNCAISCRADGAGGYTPGPMCSRAPRPAPPNITAPEVDAGVEEADREERRAWRVTPPPAPPSPARPRGATVPVAEKDTTVRGGGVVML